jgi:tRNA pseudouridine65 synthase
MRLDVSGLKWGIQVKSLPVLYQDEHLVAVNKPSGLLVHRSAIDRHEPENAMKIVRDQMGQWVFPFHRLDKSTSGVLVFALDRETARRMTQLFSDAKVSKTYLAVVRGFTPEADRINHPLRDPWDKMTDQRADREKPGKDAITDYRRLATVELPYPVGRYDSARFSLVQAAPLTGRNHQIRRHMKHVFHPVIGDTTYGDGRQNDFFRSHFQCRRLLLHASSISFPHPCTGQPLPIDAPLDAAFSSLLETLRWEQLTTDVLRT